MFTPTAIFFFFADCERAAIFRLESPKMRARALAPRPSVLQVRLQWKTLSSFEQKSLCEMYDSQEVLPLRIYVSSPRLSRSAFPGSENSLQASLIQEKAMGVIWQCYCISIFLELLL
jgi:hypothetical protein